MSTAISRSVRAATRCCRTTTLRPISRSLHASVSNRLPVPTFVRRNVDVPSPIEAPKAPLYEQAHLTTREYENIANDTMDRLHENLEIYVEEYGPEGPGAWEVEYSSGVMTLSLASRGTYVINKQPPNQQIWMSSPISGPSRFSYSKEPQPEGTWYHHRTAMTLGDILDRELKATLADEGAGDGWQGTGLL